jgi:hypothetical protein
VKNNKELSFEIAGLDEIGYKLAESQADLTTLQKLYLLHAYHALHTEREHTTDKRGKGVDHVEDQTFKDKYRERLKNRRK